MDQHNEHHLAEAITRFSVSVHGLDHELHALRVQRHGEIVTKHDLAASEARIIAAIRGDDDSEISAEDKATLSSLLVSAEDWTKKLEALAGQPIPPPH